VRFNQASAGNDYKLLSESSYPHDGKTWMHFAATFDGSEIRLYIDGELDASMPAPDLLIHVNDLPLSIGAEDDGDRGYVGAVDEVRVFNYALDGAWLIEQMQANLVPDRDGDGFIDANDAFPDDSSEWIDTDGNGIGDNTDLDDDGDGMPDGWELANGFDPRLAADASWDADEDGVANHDEFLWNTNPHGEIARKKPTARRAAIARQ